MRHKLLTILFLIQAFSNAFPQEDFLTLDKLNYDAFLKGDQKVFDKTAKQLIDNGSDYYYLRLRIGINAFNHKIYGRAVKSFEKALLFYSSDTISREYIYYSYIYAGRYNDAYKFLSGLPANNLNHQLKSVPRQKIKYVYADLGFSSTNDKTLSTAIPSGYFYEAISNTMNVDFGMETYFNRNWTGLFTLTRFKKSGVMYSDYYPTGTDPEFIQHQLYTSLTRLFYPGWELSVFGHMASYSGVVTDKLTNGNRVIRDNKFEITEGLSLTKRGWYLRGEIGLSASNFSFSNQLRGEASLTIYPTGNLNIYYTSSGMYQHDNKWGNTFQLSQDLGFKLTKFLWMQTGFTNGNSFLYSRNRGYILNNSYNNSNRYVYLNLLFLLGKHVNLSISAYQNNYSSYYWNFDSFTRNNQQSFDAIGTTISLTIKP